MVKHIGVQMDPVEKINIAGDSSFALMLEAQNRGFELFTYHPDHMFMKGKQLYARGSDLEVFDRQGAHFTKSDPYVLDLSKLDVVLLRQDPPFDMHYITSTHMLERIHPKTLVVNDPFHVRNAPEKLFVMEYPALMPPTLITRQLADVKTFREEYDDIIIKPLYGNGGAGVFRLMKEDTNLGALVEMFDEVFREPFIVQQYLPLVRAGDKRIILVDGEPVGALNRIPAKDETRSNMHVGGRPELIDLTERDREICAAIGSELKRRGLLFTGIDVIGDKMTEINVTSPTGIREIARFGGADIAALIWDAIEAKL
ncbi:MAG: glutathione synthase [Hyphomicrobiaceae bacterium]|nr:glutathione synthase [Hyphomicrobiaceae bacterium]